jgi:hypothetical protein
MTESQKTDPATPTDDTPRNWRYAGSPPEPAMLRFARILWRRKALVVLGALLPTILVALAIYLWPVQYTTTFVYQRPLTESEYDVLLRRFYSAENLGKIVARLRERGIADYAAKLEQAETEEALEKLIRFRVSPAYPARLQTTDPNTSEQIGLFKAKLFYIKITGDSKSDMAGISDVITANFASVLPLYDIRDDVIESIREFEKLVAEIDDNRFTNGIDLQKETARLEKLLSVADGPSEAAQPNVVLQFTEVAESWEFLPLSSQIQTAQTKIIDLQETLRSDKEMYSYYLKVLELNGRLLRQIEGNLLTDYTVQEFVGFLDEQLGTCKEEALADYMKSYIRKTHNLRLVNTRASEKPVVYPVPKHILGRGALALVVFLMVMACIAVALEYGHEWHVPSAARS